MKRDSLIWLFGFVAAVGTFLLTEANLLVEAGVSHDWQARIKLLAALAGFIAGLLRMSPLAMSRDNPMAGTSDPSRTVHPLVSKPDDPQV